MFCCLQDFLHHDSVGPDTYNYASFQNNVGEIRFPQSKTVGPPRARTMIKETLVSCALIATVFVNTAVAQQSSARVDISDDLVKIGVLSDMSSLYSAATGKGSLTAGANGGRGFRR